MLLGAMTGVLLKVENIRPAAQASRLVINDQGAQSCCAG